MKIGKYDTLIVDLDNTLFDWFALWYASFNPVYREILRVSNLPVDVVQEKIRKVHQSRRTSEYSFLLEELSFLQSSGLSGDVRKSFSGALAEAKRERDKNLSLYPDVLRSLWDIKKKGTKIVAYTESMGFYSAYRLKRFGLDGVIDVLFCPQDHDAPSGISIDQLRSLPEDFYELQVTELRHTPPGELKPNPRVLLDIIQAVGSNTSRCVYVGDSLFKDVAMARDVNVFDVHAKYGESQRKPEYSLLQKVSHWTESDVQREKDITERGLNFEPSAVLESSFREIFEYCEFEKFKNGDKDQKEEQELKNVIEVWKKTVDVQQHFNDLCMRIRNFAITVVGALIAAVGFTYQQGLGIEAYGVRLSAGLGFIVAAASAWLAFFFMDYYWYHVLLKGSVVHAAKIENQYSDKIPGLSLGKSVSDVSGRVTIFGYTTNSNKRLMLFYIIGFLMIGVVFITLLFAKSEVRNATTSQSAPHSEKQK